MHVTARRLRLLSALSLLSGLVATPVSAIDVTGSWLFGYDSQWGYVEQVSTLSQTGTALSLSPGGYSGTIDPDTGVFALSAVHHCSSLENPIGVDVTVTKDGTFSADGMGMTGTFYEVFQSGRACYEASGTMMGMRLVATTSVTSTSSSTITSTSTIATTTIVTTTTSTSTTLPTTRLSTRSLTLTAPADARRKRLVLDARDPDVTIGLGDGSADDPTLHGGTLRVRIPGSDDVYDLPAASWTRVSSGYRYRDTRQLAGPITNVDVKPGRQIKIVGRGAALGHELDVDPGAVTIFLTVGARASCMSTFGGTNRFKPGKLTSKNAGAPSSCAP